MKVYHGSELYWEREKGKEKDGAKPPESHSNALSAYMK